MATFFAALPDEQEQLALAEKALRDAHEANEARKRGTVFGYETYASLRAAEVGALLRELERLRSIMGEKDRHG